MKLKYKIAMKIIKQWLAEILEAFKAKNPYLWGCISLIALCLQFGIEAVIPGSGLPPEFLSLDWIIATLGLHVNDTVTDLIMSVLMLLTGSKTALYLPPAKSKAVIDDLVVKSRLKN